MHEKGSPFPMADSQGKLECKDLWGGIFNRDVEVSAGKVIGSIYSAPCCAGGKGGDISGHGEAVSEISQFVYDALKAHM
jgi:hypothetical protein